MTWRTQLRHESVVVSALCITQTLAWASTYYLTAVFTDPVSEDLHLSRTCYGSVSAALLLSGLLGPLAGGGRPRAAVFRDGSGQPGCGLARARRRHRGFGLYEAAFATVAGLYGREARSAITGITLFAGFASTVGWPLSAALIDGFGWRGALLAWACLHLRLGLPFNRLLVPKSPPPAPARASAAVAPAGVPWTMIILAGVFGATLFVFVALQIKVSRIERLSWLKNLLSVAHTVTDVGRNAMPWEGWMQEFNQRHPRGPVSALR